MNLLELSTRLSKAALGKRVEVRGHLPPDLSQHVGEVFDVEETAEAVVLHVASATLAYVAPADPVEVRGYYQLDRTRCVKIIRHGASLVRCVLRQRHVGDCAAMLPVLPE